MYKCFMPNRKQNLCFRSYISKWNLFKSNHVLKSTQLNSVTAVEVYIYICKCVCAVISVVSNSLWSYVSQPIRFLCPWDSPSKSILGVGCHFLLHGIFLIQELNLKCISCIGRQVLYQLVPSGNPIHVYVYIYLLHMCIFCWMLYYCLNCMYFQVFYEKNSRS